MQQWLIFALFAALLTGIVSILDKKILFKEHAMEFSAVFSLTNADLSPKNDYYLVLLNLKSFVTVNEN